MQLKHSYSDHPRLRWLVCTRCLEDNKMLGAYGLDCICDLSVTNTCKHFTNSSSLLTQSLSNQKLKLLALSMKLGPSFATAALSTTS